MQPNQLFIHCRMTRQDATRGKEGFPSPVGREEAGRTSGNKWDSVKAWRVNGGDVGWGEVGGTFEEMEWNQKEILGIGSTECGKDWGTNYGWRGGGRRLQDRWRDRQGSWFERKWKWLPLAGVTLSAQELQGLQTSWLYTGPLRGSIAFV